ncbi:MAG: DUF58 domain-containing protein [Phycisphaerales bacterium]|nr:DUF58 domain-containing protein [Phycisphaerales bacterium]|tara:strand:+ start:1059 stop:1982 length:924 start_codon:yes stop_codon:yes gene_type:complete
MSVYGEGESPRSVEDLLGSALMSRLNRLDVLSRKVFSGKIHGERRSRRRGQSVDFADYRPYAAGDDLRFVDWNIYARLETLFLKLFMEEEDLSLAIAVDTSPSMDWGGPNKLGFCKRLAMSLGYIGLVNQHRVSLFGFDGDGVSQLNSIRGRSRTREMANWLIDLSPGSSPGLETGMKSIAQGRRGRGVLVVLSDFLEPDGYDAGLRYLAGSGDDVFCLQVLAPEELDPGSQGLSGDVRLRDVETGQDCEITVTPALLRRYRENLDAYCSQLRDWCTRRGIGNLSIGTDVDMEVLLVEYLRRQGLLQ